jgi:anti-anti-sigma factor
LEQGDGAPAARPAPHDHGEPNLAGLGVSPVRDVERGHEWTLLVLGGELDLHCSETLEDALERERMRGAKRLVLDLQGVTFLDSTALRVLLTARSRLRADHGELVLVAPTRPVRRVLDVSGVSRLLTIHDDTSGGVPGDRPPA